MKQHVASSPGQTRASVLLAGFEPTSPAFELSTTDRASHWDRRNFALRTFELERPMAEGTVALWASNGAILYSNRPDSDA